MKGLLALQEQITNNILRHRRMLTLAMSRRFRLLWRLLDGEDKIQLDFMVRICAYDDIVLLLERLQVKEIAEMTVRELRAMAKSNLVPNYSRLAKCELITTLEELENVKEQS